MEDLERIKPIKDLRESFIGAMERLESPTPDDPIDTHESEDVIVVEEGEAVQLQPERPNAIP